MRLFASSKSDDAVATIQEYRPAVKSFQLERKPVDPKREDYMAEYSELATALGLAAPDLRIEAFKTFLFEHDLPIFSLSEVIEYMDAKAAKESKQKAGWEWRPLREKDNRQMRFGRACERPDGHYSPPRLGQPASDYYAGPSRATQSWYSQQLGNGTHEVQSREYDKKGEHQVYDRTIPLHAVRRVALIEREHKGDVAFFVSDYALLPEVLYPDPFLMAVIPNINVANGTGRFIIDFWEEPGFGIDKMLK